MALAALALIATGCRKTGRLGTLTDSTYVATMRDLRALAADTALDSAARTGARAAVLQRHGVTAAQMEDAARVLARDPQQAVAIWTQITLVHPASPPVPPEGAHPARPALIRPESPAK